MQAMILAAGFGTRLRPYTDHLPKPLFPLLGKPLLLLHIDRLQKAGFDHIIVNCHYKREMIRQAVAGIEGLFLQEEEEILGTGGGLRRAVEQLKDEPLLVVNGDIYHTIDPSWLYTLFLEQHAPVLLAVHDYPRFNKLQVTGDTVNSFHGGETGNSVAFTGMHVLKPAILEDIVDGRKSCIIEHYSNLLARGVTIGAARIDHCYWRDIGTPRDYLSLHGDLLTGSVSVLSGWEKIADARVCIAPDAQIAKGFSWKDWCVVGKADVGEDVTICRSVVWDGAVIADGSVITDTIVSR